MSIRQLHISVIVFVITIFSFNLKIVNGWGGGSPPSPSGVSSMVNSKWQASEFSELETYITNLYSSFPDYIPAKLASIFHDVVYEGHLSDAMQKANQVKQWVEQNPEGISDDFNWWFEIIEFGIQSEIDVYTQKGISEEQLQPDPAEVKAACGEDPFPLIKILEYCDFAEESLPWYDSDWDYRKKITIQNTNVDSDLNNFPLYVKIASDSDIGSHAQADGDDIRFTLSNGTTAIPYEKEAFSINGGSAEGHFWVKIPTISSGSETKIYIYYGNSVAANR